MITKLRYKLATLLLKLAQATLPKTKQTSTASLNLRKAIDQIKGL